MDGTPQTSAFAASLDGLLAELFTRSGGGKFGLHHAEFCAILLEIVAKYSPPDAPESALRELLSGLKVEELALARCCAAGNERAWEVFLTRYRGKLYDMALQITREDSSAHDLANSIYADLYGTSERGGKRISRLASYTGRGSLEGWLRTVLAQEHVNRYRKQKRLVSLEEESEEGAQFAAPAGDAEPAGVHPQIETATDRVLAALEAEDRLLLASYYLDGRTLAEIARMMGVHESTVSRKLDKLAKSIRKKLLADMAASGMSRRQAEEALEVDVRDLRLDVRKTLAQESPGVTFNKKNVQEAGAGDGSG
jgi:RNA polymerase sigma-70 factor (ECF subfamily)